MFVLQVAVSIKSKTSIIKNMAKTIERHQKKSNQKPTIPNIFYIKIKYPDNS